MADTLQFELVSPERKLASIAATSVQIPGIGGDFTAMPNHAPFLTTLRPGVVRVVAGGFVTLLVKLNDTVTQGQKIAIQRNGFGDIVHEYLAPADGRVAIIGTDAATERGSRIASILVKRASCSGGQCDYDGIVP